MATLVLAVSPAVMQDPRLELLDKLILSYVLNWEERGKSCFAKDGFFAGLYGVSDDEVRFSIFKLEAYKLITCIVGTGGRLIKSVKTENCPAPVVEKDIFEI